MSLSTQYDGGGGGGEDDCEQQHIFVLGLFPVCLKLSWCSPRGFSFFFHPRSFTTVMSSPFLLLFWQKSAVVVLRWAGVTFAYSRRWQSRSLHMTCIGMSRRAAARLRQQSLGNVWLFLEEGNGGWSPVVSLVSQRLCLWRFRVVELTSWLVANWLNLVVPNQGVVYLVGSTGQPVSKKGWELLVKYILGRIIDTWCVTFIMDWMGWV